MITPMPGFILVEPISRSEAEQKSSIPGFEVAKPKFEGTPNMGKVYAVADVSDIKHGQIVIFSTEPTPAGFKHEGLKLMAVPKAQIMAVINE